MTVARTPERLRLRILAAYALPAAPLSVVIFPTHAVLPGFYAQHTHIPLAVIGAILICARAFDALVDPFIGFLSDATVRRRGTRKPWLLAGALVLAVSVIQLYGPGPDAGAAYYLGWFLAFYLGYSLIEIPYKAWGTELARGYVDRSRIAAGLAIAFGLGNLAFALAPLLSGSGRAAYDASTLRMVGWAVAATCPLAVLVALLAAPSGPALASRRTDPLALVRAVRRNRPLGHFLGMFLLTGLGQGLFYGLVFLYVGPVLGLGASFAWVLLADAAVTLLAAPVWFFLVRRLQKHRAWALGVTISAAALMGMILVPAGAAGLAPLLALVGLRAFGSGVTQVAPNALLGDVIDYELLKGGVNQAANFHALVSLVTKLTVTVGGGAGLLLVGLAGFDPQAVNRPAALTVFKAVALVAPAAILVGAAALALAFPLHRRRHDIVRRRIEERPRHADAL